MAHKSLTLDSTLVGIDSCLLHYLARPPILDTYPRIEKSQHDIQHSPLLVLTAASSTASKASCFARCTFMTDTPSAMRMGTVTGPVVTAPQSHATPRIGRRLGLPLHASKQAGMQATTLVDTVRINTLLDPKRGCCLTPASSKQSVRWQWCCSVCQGVREQLVYMYATAAHDP